MKLPKTFLKTDKIVYLGNTGYTLIRNGEKIPLDNPIKMHDSDSKIASLEAENQALRDKILKLEGEIEDFKALASELYSLKEMIMEQARKNG